MPLPGMWRRYGQALSLATLCVSLGVFVSFAVRNDAALITSFSAIQRQQLLQFQRTGSVRSPFIGARLHALDDQRRHATSCARSRFFIMGLFFYPLELQDPAYHNLVFYLPSKATGWAQMLPSNQLGWSACDYIVAVDREETVFEDHYIPVSREEISHWLPAATRLEDIGDSGRYRVYHVLPR